MNPLTEVLPDVQEHRDTRGVALDEVGVAGLSYPATVVQPDGVSQPTVVEAEMVVRLRADVRGTHMSRFVQALHDHRESLLPDAGLVLARELTSRLGTEHARVKLEFPLFVPRCAPVSGLDALLRVDCTVSGSVSGGGEQVWVGVRVPVTSLCPCSKEIAEYGAHSQRGYITIDILDNCWAHSGKGTWPQQLIQVADDAASAPVYPVLKRVDERLVTMQAYDRPAFVEDLCRDVAVALRDDARVAAFVISVTNEESIHDHRAVARVRWSRL